MGPDLAGHGEVRKARKAVEETETRSVEIPDKKFFKIGEAADLLGIKPYILRYWESEFKALHPKKTSTLHRKYSRADLELLFEIKDLLYVQQYTIAGASRQLQKKAEAGDRREEPMVQDPLEGARVAALEQQLQMTEARLEAALRERHDALATAQFAAEALKEVGQAHEEAQAEVARLEAALKQAEWEADRAIRTLQTSLGAAVEEVEALKAEREALGAERDRLLAMAQQDAPAEQDPRPDEDQERPSNLIEIEDLRRAQEAALAEAQRTEQDLRHRLRTHMSQKQRVLKEIRAELLSMKALAHSMAE